MNPVNSVPEADLSRRAGQDDAGGPGPGGDMPSRASWTQRPLQDIQDLVDKLAAVTQQLRHPGGGVRSSSR